MAILWICGSRFLPRDPKKHDHSSGITDSVGTIIIYHEWPDMLQYMDKNVKIYHITGNIILFRYSLVNLSILYHKLTNSCYRTLHPALQDIRSLMSPEKQMSACIHLFFLEAHYIMFQNSLVNLSTYIMLRNTLENLSTYIMFRNDLVKSIKSSFQTIYRCF